MKKQVDIKLVMKESICIKRLLFNSFFQNFSEVFYCHYDVLVRCFNILSEETDFLEHFGFIVWHVRDGFLQEARALAKRVSSTTTKAFAVFVNLNLAHLHSTIIAFDVLKVPGPGGKKSE